MKKFILILILFSYGSLYSQTDLEIAKALIGKKALHIEETLDTIGIEEYYITVDKEDVIYLFISKNNSVRQWELTHQSFIGPSRRYLGADVIVSIFVRYRNANINDLREYNSYSITSKKDDCCSYEKKMGQFNSHLKVKLR